MPGAVQAGEATLRVSCICMPCLAHMGQQDGCSIPGTPGVMQQSKHSTILVALQAVLTSFSGTCLRAIFLNVE